MRGEIRGSQDFRFRWEVIRNTRGRASFRGDGSIGGLRLHHRRRRIDAHRNLFFSHSTDRIDLGKSSAVWNDRDGARVCAVRRHKEISRRHAEQTSWRSGKHIWRQGIIEEHGVIDTRGAQAAQAGCDSGGRTSIDRNNDSKPRFAPCQFVPPLTDLKIPPRFAPA